MTRLFLFKHRNQSVSTWSIVNIQVKDDLFLEPTLQACVVLRSFSCDCHQHSLCEKMTDDCIYYESSIVDFPKRRMYQMLHSNFFDCVSWCRLAARQVENSFVLEGINWYLWAGRQHWKVKTLPGWAFKELIYPKVDFDVLSCEIQLSDE